MRRATTPNVQVFAALADATRLRLVERLRRAPGQSTSALGAGEPISRQAITKHLEVLAEAGLVRATRAGRERLWQLDPTPLQPVEAWITALSAEWESRFDRLEAFLQSNEHDPE